MASYPITYLAGSPDGKVQRKTTTRTLGGVEVLVRITHSGVCGTDSHDRTNGCALGHEGIGIVEVVGSEVTAVRVGDRLANGCKQSYIHMHSSLTNRQSCGSCRECLAGYRQCCPQSVGQKYDRPDVEGTFSTHVVRHQDFVYPIPDGIASQHAAPLICAGITVYEALQVAEAKATDRVGVVGLGGLGHLAVLYARAMGCDVVVLSGHEDKREHAWKLGASKFHVLQPRSSSATTVTDSVPTDIPTDINVMLLCGGSMSNLDEIMPFLGRRARIIPLVIQSEPLIIPYMPLILAGHRIIGSTSAKRENHAAALALAARHHIRPWIEEYSMSVDGLTDALEKLQSGSIAYRAVLSKELGDDLS